MNIIKRTSTALSVVMLVVMVALVVGTWWAPAQADTTPPRDLTPAYSSHEECIVLVEDLAQDFLVVSRRADESSMDVLGLTGRVQQLHDANDRLRGRLDHKAATIQRLRARLAAVR